MTQNPIRFTHRGEYRLSAEARGMQRDLTGENIRNHFGKPCISFRVLTEDARNNFEVIVFQPGAAYIPWLTFTSPEQFNAWRAAYDIAVYDVKTGPLTGEPTPGNTLSVQFPADDSGWQPLRDPDAEGVEIEFDWIKIDTAKWVEHRTGGEISNLNDGLKEFYAHARELHRYHSFDDSSLTELFITARVGNNDWRHADYAVSNSSNGGALVNLSDDVLVYRYQDPEHGAVAIVLTDDTGRQIYDDSTAYFDTVTDGSYWLEYDRVEIFCTQNGGHGWYYRSDELATEDGSYVEPKEIFPKGILTRDEDEDSETYNDYRIICPTHGTPCGLELSSL